MSKRNAVHILSDEDKLFLAKSIPVFSDKVDNQAHDRSMKLRSMLLSSAIISIRHDGKCDCSWYTKQTEDSDHAD